MVTGPDHAGNPAAEQLGVQHRISSARARAPARRNQKKKTPKKTPKKNPQPVALQLPSPPTCDGAKVRTFRSVCAPHTRGMACTFLALRKPHAGCSLTSPCAKGENPPSIVGGSAGISPPPYFSADGQDGRAARAWRQSRPTCRVPWWSSDARVGLAWLNPQCRATATIHPKLPSWDPMALIMGPPSRRCSSSSFFAFARYEGQLGPGDVEKGNSEVLAPLISAASGFLFILTFRHLRGSLGCCTSGSHTPDNPSEIFLPRLLPSRAPISALAPGCIR